MQRGLLGRGLWSTLAHRDRIRVRRRLLPTHLLERLAYEMTPAQRSRLVAEHTSRFGHDLVRITLGVRRAGSGSAADAASRRRHALVENVEKARIPKNIDS